MLDLIRVVVFMNDLASVVGFMVDLTRVFFLWLIVELIWLALFYYGCHSKSVHIYG